MRAQGVGVPRFRSVRWMVIRAVGGVVVEGPEGGTGRWWIWRGGSED